MRTRFRRWIWPHPALYSVVNRIYRPETLQPRNADIVIDGFPRSGNWFSYAAFALSQPQAIRICHHHHSPTVILEGARLGKPTLLLVRHPRAALISAIVGQPHRTWSEFLDFYLDYYAMIRPHRDDVTVAPFDDVTQDFGKFIRRLNHRHGTNFGEFRHTAENVDKCFHWLAEVQRATSRDLHRGIVGHPAVERDPLRREAEVKLDRALQSSDRYAQQFTEAEALFRTFVATAAFQKALFENQRP